MFGLKVPIVSIVIGEGGSGGALAIGCANKLLMLENAVFYVARYFNGFFFSFFFFSLHLFQNPNVFANLLLGICLACLVLLKRLDSLSAVEIITPVSYNSCRGKGFSKICLDNSL
jgi:hypothetical protein